MKILLNELELSYAPVSAYHFRNLIRSKHFVETKRHSHIYVIAQAKELFFKDLSFIENDAVLRVTIAQDDNPNTVICKFPIIQKEIASEKNEIVLLRGYDRNGNQTTSNFQAIDIVDLDPESNDTSLLIWFSPAKLLQNLWTNGLKGEIIGDFKSMLNYKVHYVGKATEQNICKRLSKHSTFQGILTSELPLTYGNIPSNEIMVLLFNIRDNNVVMRSTVKEMTDFIMNGKLPSDKAVSLDAEKALIRYLQPKYNKILFNSYPTPKDMLSRENYSNIMYSISDPITLIYDDGMLIGARNHNERTYIEIK
ncbi:MAG: hypothetical protein WC155_03645 [Candidatus Cloacimonadales bacterium]